MSEFLSQDETSEHLLLHLHADWTLENCDRLASTLKLPPRRGKSALQKDRTEQKISERREISLQGGAQNNSNFGVNEERQAQHVIVDAQDLKGFDSVGAELLLQTLRGIGISSEIELRNFSEQQRKLFLLVSERLETFYTGDQLKVTPKLSMVSTLGQRAFFAWHYVLDTMSFLGQVVVSTYALRKRPKAFKISELVSQVEEACVKAVPVVILVTFLIGVVVAYLMAMQVEKYGAQILVVNGVALTMCRELAPIIVAIITAGRSGSAYTAQLGAMKLNEEVDALTSIGLSPYHVLVLPRILALVLAMPLLVFLGDVIGILGGGVIADFYLGITPTTFIDRLRIALPFRAFMVGIIKAPVYAFVIATIGCRRGLRSEMNARSVGLSTTATVVESIVLVILLNAAFAVIFAQLGV